MLDVTTKEREIRDYCEEVFQFEIGDKASAYKKWEDLEINPSAEESLRVAYDVLRILDGGGL